MAIDHLLWAKRHQANAAKLKDDADYRFCVEEIGLVLPTPGLWEECKGDVGLLRERSE